MNDKNLKKRQLPLKLSLNLNRNKESIDPSFSTASRLKNAPVYNNAISNYFGRRVSNEGPTVYDKSNKAWSVDSNGNFISGNVTLFKVDLKKFEREELSFGNNVFSVDGDEYALADNGTYVDILHNGQVEHSISITGNLITGKIKDGCVVLVTQHSDGNLYEKESVLSSGVWSDFSEANIYWYHKGSWKITTSLTSSVATAEYTDLQALYNTEMRQFDPLIQICPVEGGFGISILYKKGLSTSDTFAFATTFIHGTTRSSGSSLTYVFQEGSVVEVQVTVKLQLALVLEAPFHYFDKQLNIVEYEEAIAGTFVRGYARLVNAVVDYPVSIRLNWSWPSLTKNPGGKGNLPVKYGRRKYDNGAYTVQGGDNKTNWSASNGINYRDIFSTNIDIAINRNDTTWHYADTEKLEYDTQIAVYQDTGNNVIGPNIGNSSSGLIMSNANLGRGRVRPTITSVVVTIANSSKTIDVNSSNYCYVYQDPFNNCDRDWNFTYFHTFFNNDEYIYNYNNGSYTKPRFYSGSTPFSHSWTKSNWPGWLSLGTMPKTHMNEYLTDFGTTLTKLENNRTSSFCNIWITTESLGTRSAIDAYNYVWSQSQVSQSAVLGDHSKYVAYPNQTVEGTFTFQVQEGFSGSFNKHPQYLMEDGCLYNSDYRSFNSTDSDAFALRATIDSINWDNNFTIRWVIDKSININPQNLDKYYKGTTRFINDGVYAVTIAYSFPTNPYGNASPTNGSDWSDEDKWYFCYYDNCLNNVIANPGVTPKESYIGYGSAFYKINQYYHTQGLAKEKNKWRLLYNSSSEGDSLSGISYSGDTSKRGTVLTPWFSVKDNVRFYGDYCIYRDTDDRWQKIYITDGYDIKIYFDRYIVINTTSYNNAYDMETETICHFAEDWNNRLCFGREASNVSFIETNNNLTLLEASSVGEQYTIDNITMPSSILNPIPLSYWNGDTNIYTYASESDINLNIYSTIGTSTIAKYFVSMVNNVPTTDSNLIGLSYPVTSSGTLYLNPDLFMKQLRSYTNSDMFYEGESSYAVSYYNNQPVFIYNLTTLQKNLGAVFIIQSQRYGVINDKIVSLTYNNNIITNVESVCDVKGLKYIGFLPSAAFFFSPKTRCIYQFTGDADLTMLVECTEINDITNTYYDTATKTLYWLTENGFYAFSGDYCWFIEANDVDTFYTSDTDVIIKYKNHDTTFLRLEPFDDYEKVPYEVETSYYGSSENKISKISCMYVQTLNDFVEPDDYMTLCAKSQTDKETATDTKDYKRKTIQPYIPRYDIGIGTSFTLKGTIPIKSITLDVNEIGASQKASAIEEIR